MTCVHAPRRRSWHYPWINGSAYPQTAALAGGGAARFAARQRPHMVLGPGGEPAALTNGAQLVGEGGVGGDATFTFLQPVRQQPVRGGADNPARLKLDDHGRGLARGLHGSGPEASPKTGGGEPQTALDYPAAGGVSAPHGGCPTCFNFTVDWSSGGLATPGEVSFFCGPLLISVGLEL